MSFFYLAFFEHANCKDDHKAADESLTRTVCEIYPDRIEIRRYDEKGMHVLGAEGEGNPYKGGIDEGLIDARYHYEKTDSPFILNRKNYTTEEIHSAGEDAA